MSIKQALKLFWLVLRVNGLEQRKRTLTGDAPTAFLYFCGHTASIDVTICPNGWGEGSEKKTFCIWTDKDFSSMEYYACVQYLKSLLKKESCKTAILQDSNTK